ncbi:MAG: 50S ribosomal protein L5, partial [Candidatus Ryanbacteria bacterium]|nr:50S ribosomal protein L5 [Candidatus Ryanbacteria bacterium]
MSAKHLQEFYKEKTLPAFREHFKTSNYLAVPRIEKVVVNVGTGRARDDKELEETKKALVLITGQAPQARPARIAIASFKTRQGMVIGYRVTLRGKRMYDFLERLVFSAIPRMRDFRGIKESAIDEYGNLNLGIREHIIFPEMIGEDVRRIFSFQVTVVTNAGSREKAKLLFETLGFPLAKRQF